ncbi:MAG TPA: NTP transferase domain-containing protein, partial [Odoribacter splanchnicus]|nr:NTP transferase domain-containing protein [Odoribacter splanchnicus]
MLNIAVILAGGSGQRAGGGIPKQFKKINDKTILEYSLEK